MPVLYVSEYISLPVVSGKFIQAGDEPAVATQTVPIGAGSLQSVAFNPNTRFVRVHTDAICSVLFGADPTATAASPRMAAGSTEFFGVKPGHKVAVITNT